MNENEQAISEANRVLDMNVDRLRVMRELGDFIAKTTNQLDKADAQIMLRYLSGKRGYNRSDYIAAMKSGIRLVSKLQSLEVVS